MGAKAKINALRDLKTRVNQLIETFDEDGKLQERLEKARTDQTTAERLKSDTKRKIKELLPELLEADRDRIERALEQKRGQLTELRSQIAVARAALRNDGYEDPKATLASAEAKASIADEHWKIVNRKANAVALLNRLFQEEQRSLAERFTQPLADKITDYLRFVFGPNAQATVKLENNQFTSLRLSRPENGTFEFSDLSGGAREQLAAAVRLAMAEVLAADHGGSLPIIFDDAFACSDPVRIQALQRMLDLAARRGIQVIMLTCNPEEYAAFGALQVKLRVDCQRSADHQRAALIEA